MATDVFTIGTQEKVIEVVINGNSSSVEVSPGTTLIDFVTEQAQGAGIRTFSVYIDGQKADTSQAGKDITTASKVEIVAKDARG